MRGLSERIHSPQKGSMEPSPSFYRNIACVVSLESEIKLNELLCLNLMDKNGTGFRKSSKRDLMLLLFTLVFFYHFQASTFKKNHGFIFLPHFLCFVGKISPGFIHPSVYPSVRPLVAAATFTMINISISFLH